MAVSVKTFAAFLFIAVATTACSSESTITRMAPDGGCSYSVSPTGIRVPITGGTSAVSVMTSSSSACVWTASTGDAWIRLSGTTTGRGAGVVTVAVDQPTTVFRRGSVSVGWSGGGASIGVDQGCPMVQAVTLSPEKQLYQIGIPSGCSFYSTPGPITFDVPWISFVSTGGNGTLLLVSVDVNPGPERIGHVTTGLGQITFTQGAGNCVTGISPTAQTFDEAGGGGTIAVSGVPGCTWDAIAHDYFDANLTPVIAHGSGSGVVQFTVAPNTYPFGLSPFFVVGGALHFQITQTACPLTVSPLSVRVPAAGGEFSIAVTVMGRVNCQWSDYSNDKFITGAYESRIGSGIVHFSVAANQSGQPRGGSTYVAARTVVVTQDP